MTNFAVLAVFRYIPPLDTPLRANTRLNVPPQLRNNLLQGDTVLGKRDDRDIRSNNGFLAWPAIEGEKKKKKERKAKRTAGVSDLTSAVENKTRTKYYKYTGVPSPSSPPMEMLGKRCSTFLYCSRRASVPLRRNYFQNTSPRHVHDKRKKKSKRLYDKRPLRSLEKSQYYYTQKKKRKKKDNSLMDVWSV